MTETQPNHYEAMFLVSQASATDLAAVVAHITQILTKNEADIIAMKKWDERRLAYEIDKQRRGVFILTYFTAPPQALEGIERECNLSEVVVRQLVTRIEHLTEDEMRAADAREDLAFEAAVRQ